MRSAMAPETMVAAVAQNTVWKIIKTPGVRSLNCCRSMDVGSKKPVVPTMGLLPPNIRANPMTKKQRVPRTKSIKFFIMMLLEFFALVKPVSTIAKPACMKKTRKAAMQVHTIFNNCCTSILISSFKTKRG